MDAVGDDVPLDQTNVAKLDAMAEKKVEVDDETEFKLNLRHLLDKHAQ